MSRRYLTAALLGLLLLAGLALPLLRLLDARPASAQTQPATDPATGAPATQPAGKDAPELAELRKVAQQYLQAFNQGDAKTLAAMWMPEGEYFGPDGVTVKGRANVEKAYTEFFKKNPGAKLAVEVETLRRLGANTALEEGLLRLTRPGRLEPEVTRYSSVQVREGGKWLTAVAREFDVDPAELLSVKDLAWLVGDWYAKGAKGELTAHYQWDENKVFLLGTFELKENGKIITRGIQRLGKDAAEGKLRNWIFESSGAFGESLWARDGKTWIVEAGATLPDGTQTTATNLITPIDSDTFTFQSVNRTLGGNTIPDLPPIKVTRVKK